MTDVFMYADETGNLDYNLAGGGSRYFGIGAATWHGDPGEHLWQAGPGQYSARAYAGLRSHDGLPITAALADRWLGHFRRAMAATVAAEHDRETIFAQVRPLAMALVSRPAARARAWMTGSGDHDDGGRAQPVPRAHASASSRMSRMTPVLASV
jgi:globin